MPPVDLAPADASALAAKLAPAFVALVASRRSEAIAATPTVVGRWLAGHALTWLAQPPNAAWVLSLAVELVAWALEKLTVAALVDLLARVRLKSPATGDVVAAVRFETGSPHLP